MNTAMKRRCAFLNGINGHMTPIIQLVQQITHCWEIFVRHVRLAFLGQLRGRFNFAIR